jgi:hypothetical protein
MCSSKCKHKQAFSCSYSIAGAVVQRLISHAQAQLGPAAPGHEKSLVRPLEWWEMMTPEELDEFKQMDI